MNIALLNLGGMAANCYLLSDGDTAAVVDPGEDCAALHRFADTTRLDIKYILLTHGHFDHIGGVAFLKKRFPAAQICIGREDGFMLLSCEASLGGMFGIEHDTSKADVLLEDGDELKLGCATIRVMHTPGHTPGGVVYLADDFAICGDTLFNMSIGRCDFPGSSVKCMQKSLRALAKLPKHTKIYSGHGPSSVMEYELQHNPYLREEI